MSIVPGHISSLYKNALVFLWVEDEETRMYLEEAWDHDDTIGLLVAGGCENIKAVVHSARKDGLPHVFGYRDRDFGTTNRASWNAPDLEIFICEAFELENLLLDSRAMENCQVNTTTKKAADFENEMRALAAKLDWWMACRRTIAELRDSVATDFIEHPSRNAVRTFENARDAITTSTWWSRVRPDINHHLTSEYAQTALRIRHDECRAMIDDGTWRMQFSGKEILIDMRSRVWTKKRQADPQGRIDFFKAIAIAQRESKAVPQEVIDLRLALRARVGR